MEALISNLAKWTILKFPGLYSIFLSNIHDGKMPKIKISKFFILDYISLKFFNLVPSAGDEVGKFCYVQKVF